MRSSLVSNAPDTALALLEEMKQIDGLYPDLDTFKYIITYLCNKNDYKRIIKLLHLMHKNNVLIDRASLKDIEGLHRFDAVIDEFGNSLYKLTS